MTSMSAQTSFQELTLEKALEQAKVENKYVFIDCYTSWCGPCKMMAERSWRIHEWEICLCKVQYGERGRTGDPAKI